MQVVYLDVFFGLNWWMNLLLLAVTGVFGKECPSVWRIALAAAVGAAGACAALVLPRVGQLAVLVPLLALVNRIAFPELSRRRLLKRSAFYLAAALTLGGMLDWWYFQMLGKTPRMRGLVVLAGVLAVMMILGILYMRGRGRRQTERYEVLLYVGGCHLVVQGFWDSGNRLTDALGRPVQILEADFLYEQCPELVRKEKQEELFKGAQEVPFQSLGGRGTIRVIEGERMLIPALHVEQEHPLLGLSKMPLFGDGVCHMLLHGDLKKHQ
jgi:sigma-E processing peptidase SpoIIGA